VRSAIEMDIYNTVHTCTHTHTCICTHVEIHTHTFAHTHTHTRKQLNTRNETLSRHTQRILSLFLSRIVSWMSVCDSSCRLASSRSNSACYKSNESGRSKEKIASLDWSNNNFRQPGVSVHEMSFKGSE